MRGEGGCICGNKCRQQRIVLKISGNDHLHGKKYSGQWRLEQTAKTGSHTGDQHDRLIFPDMQPASCLVRECSTDLHGNTFTAGTSSEEMSDPGAEHYQRDKGQRNLVSFSARFRRSGTCPLSLRC